MASGGPIGHHNECSARGDAPLIISSKLATEGWVLFCGFTGLFRGLLGWLTRIASVHFWADNAGADWLR